MRNPIPRVTPLALRITYKETSGNQLYHRDQFGQPRRFGNRFDGAAPFVFYPRGADVPLLDYGPGVESMNYLAYYLFLLLVVWGGVLYRASGPWQYVSSIAAVIAGVIFVRGRFWTLGIVLLLSVCTASAEMCSSNTVTCGNWYIAEDVPYNIPPSTCSYVLNGQHSGDGVNWTTDSTSGSHMPPASGIYSMQVFNYSPYSHARIVLSSFGDSGCASETVLWQADYAGGNCFTQKTFYVCQLCPEGTYRNQITCTKSVNGHNYSFTVGGDKCVNGAWVPQGGDCATQCPPDMPLFVKTYCINADGQIAAASWVRCVNGAMVEEFAVCNGSTFQHYDGDGITVPSPIAGASTLPANSLGSGGAVNPPTVNNNGTTTAPPSSVGTITPVVARPATSTVNIGNLPELANAVGAGVKEAMGGGAGSLTVSVVISNTASGTETNVPAFSGMGGAVQTNAYDWAGFESALSNNMAQVGEMWRSVTGVQAILDMVQSMPSAGSGGDLDIGAAMRLGTSYSFRGSSMYSTMSGLCKTLSTVFFTLCALGGLWITAIRN